MNSFFFINQISAWFQNLHVMKWLDTKLIDGLKQNQPKDMYTLFVYAEIWFILVFYDEML
jgi:hypothetical protein